MSSRRSATAYAIAARRAKEAEEERRRQIAFHRRNVTAAISRMSVLIADTAVGKWLSKHDIDLLAKFRQEISEISVSNDVGQAARADAAAAELLRRAHAVMAPALEKKRRSERLNRIMARFRIISCPSEFRGPRSALASDATNLENEIAATHENAAAMRWRAQCDSLADRVDSYVAAVESFHLTSAYLNRMAENSWVNELDIDAARKTLAEAAGGDLEKFGLAVGKIVANMEATYERVLAEREVVERERHAKAFKRRRELAVQFEKLETSIEAWASNDLAQSEMLEAHNELSKARNAALEDLEAAESHLENVLTILASLPELDRERTTAKESMRIQNKQRIAELHQKIATAKLTADHAESLRSRLQRLEDSRDDVMEICDALQREIERGEDADAAAACIVEVRKVLTEAPITWDKASQQVLKNLASDSAILMIGFYKDSRVRITVEVKPDGSLHLEKDHDNGDESCEALDVIVVGLSEARGLTAVKYSDEDGTERPLPTRESLQEIPRKSTRDITKAKKLK